MCKTNLLLFMLLSLYGCASNDYSKTAANVDLNKFFKKWYVIAGRFTFIEKGAHNAVEEYSFNKSENTIDINFYFNKDSTSGPLKKYPQKGWVINKVTNAHWKVSPFWPLKFDYLILAVAEDYSWTAIGVPNKKYLWIMSDHWSVSDQALKEIEQKLKNLNYPVNDIIRIPQNW